MSRVVLLLPVLALAGALVAADPPKRVVAKVTPAADTTVATGPVDKDGFIDYEVAFNERLRGRITPQSNCVNLLFTAIGPKPEGAELHPDFYKWLGREAPAADAAYLIPVDRYFVESRGANMEAFYELYTDLSKRPWTPKEQPRFADWLAENEKPLLAVTDAAARPDYYYPFVSRPRDDSPKLLIGALLPLVQKVRMLAPMLGARAMLRVGEKQYDEAWADLLAIHRLGRHMSRGGSLIELLVGVAIDTIGRTSTLAFLEYAKLTPNQLAKYREDLANLPPMSPPADKMVLSERFVYLDIIQAVRRYGFNVIPDLGELPSPNVPPEKIETVLAKLDWDRILRRGNSWYDKLEAAMRKPTRAERLTAIADVEAMLVKATEGSELTALFKEYTDEKRQATSDAVAMPLVRSLLPAVSRVQEASDRHEQNWQTMLVAFALAAHKAERGEYPEKLADLSPKYLKTVPNDMYNGEKPLIFKRTKTGYEMYSVGLNGKDDGCQLMTDTPRGDDLGVRMPAKK